MENFTVICTSNGEKNFEENTLNSFVIQLPNTISFGYKQSWLVGLRSLFLPKIIEKKIYDEVYFTKIAFDKAEKLISINDPEEKMIKHKSERNYFRHLERVEKILGHTNYDEKEAEEEEKPVDDNTNANAQKTETNADNQPKNPPPTDDNSAGATQLKTAEDAASTSSSEGNPANTSVNLPNQGEGGASTTIQPKVGENNTESTEDGGNSASGTQEDGSVGGQVRVARSINPNLNEGQSQTTDLQGTGENQEEGQDLGQNKPTNNDIMKDPSEDDAPKATDVLKPQTSIPKPAVIPKKIPKPVEIPKIEVVEENHEVSTEFKKFIYVILSQLHDLSFLSTAYFNEILEESFFKGVIFKNHLKRKNFDKPLYEEMVENYKHRKVNEERMTPKKATPSIKVDVQRGQSDINPTNIRQNDNSKHNWARDAYVRFKTSEETDKIFAKEPSFVTFQLSLQSFIKNHEIENFVLPPQEDRLKVLLKTFQFFFLTKTSYKISEILISMLQQILANFSIEALTFHEEGRMITAFIKKFDVNKQNFNNGSRSMLRFEMNLNTLCKNFVSKFVDTCLNIKTQIELERRKALLIPMLPIDTYDPSIIIVYLDILGSSQIFNHEKLKILEIVNLREIQEKGSLCFNPISYKQLSSLSFSTIAVRLTDMYGNPIKFYDTFQPVLMELNFLRVK